ncbi:MAG: hypothetical protein KBT04_05005 [Bacteroidales bacterium]|nr:hypothetical protein [Candidatus Colimorpha onthohippi]
MSKNITFFLLLALLLTTAQAQRRMVKPFTLAREHNITIAAQGGLGMLAVNNTIGAPTTKGFAAAGDVGYTFMFTLNVGLHAGVGFSYTTSGYSNPSLRSVYLDDVRTYDEETDFVGNADIVSTTSNVEETYKTMMVDIPIQMAFVFKRVWCNAGVRLSLPLSVDATYTAGPTSRGIGYIYNTGVDFPDPIPLGDDYRVAATSGSYKVEPASGKMLVSLAIEGGYRIPVSLTQELYIGAYIDYSLNRIDSDNTVQYVSYDASHSNPTFHGALQSSATDGYKYCSMGLRLYYSFGFGGKVR